jgi:hypothetical protein
MPAKTEIVYDGNLRCHVGMLYGEDILRGDLKDLSFEILQELTTELHEGTAHDGPSAVVQLVARRL